MIRKSTPCDLRTAGRLPVGERQDHVGADQELQVDLATSAPIDAAAFSTRVLGPAAALFAAPVEDHLDVPVPPKAIQQILVETGFIVGNEKEVSSHAPLHYPPDARGGSLLFVLTEHLQCHFRRS